MNMWFRPQGFWFKVLGFTTTQEMVRVQVPTVLLSTTPGQGLRLIRLPEAETGLKPSTCKLEHLMLLP